MYLTIKLTSSQPEGIRASLQARQTQLIVDQLI